MPDFPRCPYRPTQGLHKDKQCVLHVQHAELRTAHAYDASLLGTGAPAATQDDPDSTFTNAEIDELTEQEIQHRAAGLDQAQELWEQAAYRAHPKIACPECTGRGTVVGGTLGDHCPTCNGTRVIEDPGEEVEFDMPDFKTPRAALAAYGDALIWRRNGRQVALPPASSVPTQASIDNLRTSARAAHRALAAGQAPKMPELPAGDPHRSGLETEGGIEDTASDQEIDILEAEIVSETRGPRRRR